MNKLKPCPLCGNKKIKFKKQSFSEGYCSYEDYIIRCSSCGLELRMAADNYYERYFYSEEQVVDRWNRRKTNMEE